MDIDLVIPMVFPQDPLWQEDYEHYKGGSATVSRHVRYRSWDTEELLVRCCLKYMPWLHAVIILLARDSQVQPWMDAIKEEDSRLRIIFHHEFIPGDYLPCFTSPTIEMFLHRIPGLSEHFIYGNDDMFPLSPLPEEDFFLGDLPCQRFLLKPRPAHPDLFQRKCLYQQDMIDKPFGSLYTHVWLEPKHTFAPILKSVCHEVRSFHGEEIRRRLSPLKRTDRSYNHYIYLLYQHFSGLEAEGGPKERYVARGTPVSSFPEVIRNPEAGIVCFNDTESLDDWKRRALVMKREIALKLSR